MDNVERIALKAAAGGVIVPVKAVPGARRGRIVGVLGDCLKVATAAPAEKGKANADIARLLAEALGVPAKHITLHAGQSNPRKQFLVEGLSIEDCRRRLTAV
jgi:uncharacterized protein (TIGR00251 family)